MSAEIAKLRYLHFPRWTAAAVVAVALLAGALLLAFHPTTTSWYESVPPLAVGTTYAIGAIIFGVWAGSLEFSAGTLQRTLTAEPNRSRVLALKLVLVAAFALVLGLATAGVILGLTHLAARRAGIDYAEGDLVKTMIAFIPGAVAGGVIGFGLGLLTRSLGGGIAIAMVLVFVADGAISTIPGLRGWSFGAVTTDVQYGISGTGDATHGLVVASLGMLAWCLILTVPGWVAFVRGDLK